MTSSHPGDDLADRVGALDLDDWADLPDRAAALGVSVAAVLLAACHAWQLRTAGGAPHLTLTLTVPGPGPGPDADRVQTGHSAPAISESDTFARIVQAVQAELHAIPFRRDVLAGPLLGLSPSPADQPAPGIRLRVDAEDGRPLLTAEEHGPDLRLADLPAMIAEILRQALRRPETSPSCVALQADAAELRRLDRWNDTARPYPASRSVHELVAQQAAATPEAIAVEDGEFFLSYAQMQGEAARISGLLRARGVGPGSLVGVAVDRSWRLPSVLLGVLGCGAAYVPIDPAFPPDRIAFMVADCGAAIVLADQASTATLPPLGTRVVVLEELDDEPVTPVAAEPSSPGSLAYVIYTSGSTGQPKGVRVRHAGVVNLLCAARDAVGFDLSDRLLAVSSVSFDISVLEIFLPLLAGGTVVIASRREVTDGAALAARLEASRITVCQATPVTWRMAIRAGWPGGQRVLCGGEAVDPELARELIAHGGGRFWNVYGPTETTIWSCWDAITAIEGLHVPIGRPIANTAVYVLDAQLRRVPPGVQGELWIGGVGVADGYLNRPELTAERFRPDPFAAAPQARMYRTGDRVRFLPNGSIEFHGRLDHQVKLRGFRIELGDVEAALSRHPQLEQAVAAVAKDDQGVAELVAFIVARPAAGTPAVASLRDEARSWLPDHMLPSRYVLLDALPQTPNGKVDRNRLPLDAPPLLDAEKIVAPRSDREATLVRLWEDALGVSPLGVTSDFFVSGGHSLRAVRLLDLVEAEFGMRLHLNTLYFQGATPAYFAQVLREPASRPPLPSLLPLQPDGPGPALFCMHTLGNVGLFHYRLLAGHLGRRVPMFGISARGLEDDLPVDRSIGAMARHCVAVMRRQQPAGPYRLCGFSNAGLVAYEAACQLREAGDTVAGLVLLDSGGVSGWRKPNQFRRRAAQVAARLAGRPVPVEDAAAPSVSASMRWRHRLAGWRYRPRRYEDPVLLVTTTELSGDYHGDDLGWGKVASKLDTHLIASGHDDLMREPIVGTVAALVAEHLGLSGPTSS